MLACGLSWICRQEVAPKESSGGLEQPGAWPGVSLHIWASSLHDGLRTLRLLTRHPASSEPVSQEIEAETHSSPIVSLLPSLIGQGSYRILLSFKRSVEVSMGKTVKVTPQEELVDGRPPLPNSPSSRAQHFWCHLWFSIRSSSTRGQMLMSLSSDPGTLRCQRCKIGGKTEGEAWTVAPGESLRLSLWPLSSTRSLLLPHSWCGRIKRIPNTATYRRGLPYRKIKPQVPLNGSSLWILFDYNIKFWPFILFLACKPTEGMSRATANPQRTFVDEHGPRPGHIAWPVAHGVNIDYGCPLSGLWRAQPNKAALTKPLEIGCTLKWTNYFGREGK